MTIEYGPRDWNNNGARTYRVVRDGAIIATFTGEGAWRAAYAFTTAN